MPQIRPNQTPEETPSNTPASDQMPKMDPLRFVEQSRKKDCFFGINLNNQARPALGTAENPATIEEILDKPSELIRKGVYFTKPDGSVSQMEAKNFALTRQFLANAIGIPLGTDHRNPVSAPEIVRDHEKWGKRIEHKQDVYFYLSKDPGRVHEVQSTTTNEVVKHLAKQEGISLSPLMYYKLGSTYHNQTFTGYSAEDGWDSNKAAAKDIYSDPVITLEEHLAQQEKGVPFDKIPPVLIAQSMYELPYKYGQELLLKLSNGQYVRGVVLDCGDFAGSNKLDVYTDKTSTAMKLTGSNYTVHKIKGSPAT